MAYNRFDAFGDYSAAAAPTPVSQNVEEQIRYISKTVDIETVVRNPKNEYAIVKDEAYQELLNNIIADGFDKSQALKVKPKNADGKYMLISGERRWTAAREAGLTEVPIVIDNNARELSEVDENISILRANKGYRDKNIFNDVAQIKKIVETLKGEGKDDAEIKQMITDTLRKSEETAKRYLRLTKLDDCLIAYAKETGNISLNDGIAILQAIDSGKDASKLYDALSSIPEDIDAEEAAAQAKAIIDKFCKVPKKKEPPEEKPKKSVDVVKHLKKIEKTIIKESIDTFCNLSSDKRRAEFSELVERIKTEISEIEKWFEENN